MNTVYYSPCDMISLQPHSIPVLLSSMGWSFFSSEKSTLKRFKEAILPSSITQSGDTILNLLSKDTRIMTPMERLGDIGALSAIHRLLTILSSSARLRIDRLHASKLTKTVLSVMVGAVPILFLSYGVGYPLSASLLSAAIIQTAASLISIWSLSAENYLRRLDVISNSKTFEPLSYASKLLCSTTFNIIFTFSWHFKEFFLDQNYKDSYHILKFCIDNSNQSIHRLIYSRTPLIAFDEKIAWLVGIIAVDLLVVALSRVGVVKDIRSPFINAFTPERAKPPLIITNLDKHKKPRRGAQTKYTRSTVESHRDTTEQTPATPSTARQESPGSEQPPKKDKVKRRSPFADLSPLENDDAKQETTITSPTQLELHGYTFYKIDSPYKNLWGVIDSKVKKVPAAYITSLSSGQMHSKNSAIKALSASVIEVTASLGKRLLGSIHHGASCADSMFDLAPSMDVYNALKQAGQGHEVDLVIFNKLVKHEDVNKELHR